MEDINSNQKIKKYIKCSTCKLFDEVLISPLLQNLKCQICKQPLKEISLEEYNQKMEMVKKRREEKKKLNEGNNNNGNSHHNPYGIKIKVIKGNHGLHNLFGLGGNSNNNINNNNDSHNPQNIGQNNNQEHHHHHRNMIIIAPFSRHHHHSNNNEQNNQNNQSNQNELGTMVRSHNISSDVFDSNFTHFGMGFNQNFLNNFSSNFRSNFINGNFLSVILNLIQRNMAEANRHKQHPISEENIQKLKKFKLNEKYCKKENDGQYEKPNCCICLEEIEMGKETLLLPCGHMFHEGCCMNWLKKSNTCPVCRFEIK